MSREMTNSEAIANLNHIYGFVSPNIQRSLDVAFKAMERPQGELTADETRLIGEAVNYLLGADLVEENGWSDNDIKVLQSLCERYYVEDSEEEE